MGKTIGEAQDMALGGFNHEIRKMNADQKGHYAPQGSPENAAWRKRIDEADARDEYRKKAILAFDKEKPQHGNMKYLTAEEVVELRNETVAFGVARKAFMERLDREFPVIELFGI